MKDKRTTARLGTAISRIGDAVFELIEGNSDKALYDMEDAEMWLKSAIDRGTPDERKEPPRKSSIRPLDWVVVDHDTNTGGHKTKATTPIGDIEVLRSDLQAPPVMYAPWWTSGRIYADTLEVAEKYLEKEYNERLSLCVVTKEEEK